MHVKYSEPIDRPEYQTKENGYSIPIPNQGK